MGDNLSCPVNSAAEEPRTKPSPGLTLAEAIAQALFRWWKGDVERRIRNILRFCDQDTARHQVASPPASPLLSLVAFASFSFLLLSLLELWLDLLFLHCQLERIIRCLV